MQKNSEEFSIQEAMRLAKSPAGQQLIAALRQSDTETLQKAMDQASAGDYSKVKETMSSLLASPEIQQLMKQLGE